MIDNNSDIEKLTKQRRAIQKITLLPTIPATLQRIIETSNDPNSSAEDMQKIIEKDQAITAAILKLANSAFYGFTRQVYDIKQAIIITGFNTAVSVAVSVSILKSLSEEFKSSEFSQNEFWKHTIAAGEAARLIARQTNYTAQSKAYIIGLLHDIGKIALYFIDSKNFDDAVFESRAVNKPLFQCEMQAFGFDHQSSGGWLGSRWKLPYSIVSGILYHHDIESCPEEFLQEALIAHTSNHLAIISKIGNGGDISKPNLHPKVGSVLKLGNEKLKHISGALELKRKEIDTFLETLL